MALDDLLKPRFIIALVGLVIVGVLMGTGQVEQNTGLVILVGILAAFGVYQSSARAQEVGVKVMGGDDDR